MAGIYIHIPFCKQACHYCNFYFSVSTSAKANLIKAIILEVELSKNYLEGERIETIYFGGGTPSLLDADEMKLILDAIHQTHPNFKLTEVTLEANPDDLTPQKVKGLASLKVFGLNRLSIGIQSFQENDLIYMNRAHTAQEGTAAIKRAQDNGFDNLTIDLIYGTPTLTDELWLANIQQAHSLGIQHISSYALTVEPKTYLDKKIKARKTIPVNEEQTSRQFDLLITEMNKQGFDQYEISNFATPGHYAIHNTNYWKGKKYLGLGPSAHSYNGKSRSWSVANNMNYIKSINNNIIPAEIEHLTAIEQANEYIMTSLRTIWGLNVLLLKNPDFQQQVWEAIKDIDPSYYTKENNIIKLTQKGKHFADRIASNLFID